MSDMVNFWVDDYNTAISYNKDIKYYLVLFYVLSKCISNTIYRLVEKHYGIKVKINKSTYSNDHKILELFNTVDKIPHIFFPDEYSLDHPQIIIQDSNKIELRTSAYKSYLNKTFKYQGCQITTSMNGDGVTRSWALPYFGGDKDK